MFRKSHHIIGVIFPLISYYYSKKLAICSISSIFIFNFIIKEKFLIIFVSVVYTFIGLLFLRKENNLLILKNESLVFKLFV